MSTAKIFTTSSINLKATSFYPRNYDPIYLFVQNKLLRCPCLEEILVQPIKGGSTPPSYLFRDEDNGIPFVKTAAITRHFVNVNDLHFIDEKFHRNTIKRSITKPYDVIYTMTGKFMGKAALCPPTIPELNMSQNSVVLRCGSPLKAAFLTIYLNSEINRIQVRGLYSITKQKYLNQGKISKLKVIPYHQKYEKYMEDYINAINQYYVSVNEIKKIILNFSNQICSNVPSNTEKNTFVVKPEILGRSMLLPNYYHPKVRYITNQFVDDHGERLLKRNLSKGDEIGSRNYLEEGIPFIKTSDIINFDVDYEPDCYCSESFINQLSQNIRRGDIIFTKDGKPGEIAIIKEDANIIISSGFVKYRPESEEELYWLFLLLSSSYGKAYFKKWFVIASTMTHLRKDFFQDFNIPIITNEVREDFLKPLEVLFKSMEQSHLKISDIKEKLLLAFIS